MSKTVRGMVLALGLLGLLGLGACSSQAVGQRCQANLDCNTETDSCRAEVDRTSPCSGGAGCICCPTDRAAAQAIAVCAPATASTRDAGAD